LLVLATLTLDYWITADAPDWKLQLRQDLHPVAYLIACAAITIFNVIPLLEEAWRCRRSAAVTSAAQSG
jgi:hypothetical protein